MKMKKWLMLILPILMFSLLIYGWLFGFPYERHNLSVKVKEYVETKYGLTPTSIKISFSIDGMDSALVSTNELPFTFEVYISRKKKNVWHDLYLEALTKHYLENLIGDKLNDLIDVNNIRVVLENRFSKNSNLTIEKLNSNPNMVLNNPNISYFCSVDDANIDLERSYMIFSQITQFFNPTCIYIYNVEMDSKKMSIYIKKNDFNKVQKKEDLIKFVE